MAESARATSGSELPSSPPPTADDLSYFDRLEKKGQAPETLKVPDKSRPAPAEKARQPERTPSAAAVATPPPPPPPAAPKEAKDAPHTAAATAPAASDAPLAEPSGQGYALQVTAIRERGEAQAIAKRLSAKGYSAYVVSPAAGAASVYRVRVGKFKTRREAEAVATRLQKEEQFTPWITR